MTKIQLRRDTAANWSTNNPTPSAGEPCFEIDTHKFKIGDGVTKYTNLPYQGGSGLEICDIGMALYVDETKGLRRYLNGQIVDINTNTQAFLNRLKEITTLHPSLLCTEEEWQTAKTMSAFGQVGKFVFNYSSDNIVSVRLPRVVNIQGLFDLQNLGMTVDESLPNIKGSLNSTCSGTNGKLPTRVGCMNATGTGVMLNTGTGSLYVNNAIISVDASRSSSTYQDNAPVQQEAIQYPYFIQIATGSKTENNIINEIELNNPYSLFDSKYSDHELNNLSWLKSEGQWNAKAVYPTAYDKLLKVYNGTETVEGLSVKLSTETYTDYDFVLNTADETFRLPLLDGSEDLPSDRYIDLTSSLTSSNTDFVAPANGWYTLKLSSYGSTEARYIALENKTSKVINQPRAYDGSTRNIFSLSTSVEARKGDIVNVSYSSVFSFMSSSDGFTFTYAQGNGSLYFYVGETVQNANLIDAGRIGEVLAGKVDLDAQNLSAEGKSLISGLGMPSNKYIDLTLGATGATYTAPADGYFWLSAHSSAGGQHANIGNSTSGWVQNYAHGNSDQMNLMRPVRKGETVQVFWTLGGSKDYFRFIYAEGSK